MCVRVLEAANYIGGRVHQVDVGGVNFEAGGEFFHGGSSTAKMFADHINLPTEQVFTASHGDGGPDDEPAPDGSVALYVVDGVAIAHDSKETDFCCLNDALERMREMDVPVSDTRSLAQYL